MRGPGARGARRLGGAPRAFRLGTPGVDRFPIELWSRLARGRPAGRTSALLDYGDPAGLRALREAIATHVRRRGACAATADQVIIMSGAQQALELAARVLIDPGDRGLDGGAGLSRSAERAARRRARG